MQFQITRQTQQLNEIIEISFKIVFTSITKKYEINRNWTMKEFIDNISFYTKNNYPVLQNSIIEIINVSLHSEYGEPLEKDTRLKFGDYYENIKPIAFYIRPIDHLTFLINRTHELNADARDEYLEYCRTHSIREQTVLSSNTETTNVTNNNNNSYVEDGTNCYICFTNTLERNSVTEPIYLMRLIGCNHRICNTCFQQCVSRQMQNCPFCRTGQLYL